MVEGPVGALATWLILQTVETALLRDLGVIAVWLALIVGGVVVTLRLIPPPMMNVKAVPSQRQRTSTSPTLRHGAIPEVRDTNRSLTDVSPEYLAGIHKSLTDIQARKVTEPFIGKWIEVAGPLGEIMAGHHAFALLFFADRSSGSGKVPIMARFDDPPIDRFSTLWKGKNVRLLGRIVKISAASIDLEECELLDG